MFLDIIRKEEEEQTSHLNGCALVEYVQTKSLCQSSRLSHFITFLSDCLRGCDAVTVMLNSSFSAVKPLMSVAYRALDEWQRFTLL